MGGTGPATSDAAVTKLRRLSKNPDHRLPAATAPDDHPALSADAPARLRLGLQQALAQLASQQAPVLVGPAGDLAQRGNGHFHLVPELFLQLSGSTHFQFPRADGWLQPGQALLLPPRLLHAERVRKGTDGRPFANLVVQADGARLTCHLAHEATPGRPGILHLEALVHPLAGRIHDWLADAAGLAGALARRAADGASADPWAAQQARALVCAATAGVLRALADAPAGRADEPPLVARLRVLVQNQLGDQALSVRGLAALSGCTADHLSHVFAHSTGEHLVAYINRLRLARAARLLRETTMAGKQVAWACGYASHSYFSRSFRQQHGLSPKAWRAGVDASPRTAS